MDSAVRWFYTVQATGSNEIVGRIRQNPAFACMKASTLLQIMLILWFINLPRHILIFYLQWSFFCLLKITEIQKETVIQNPYLLLRPWRMGPGHRFAWPAVGQVLKRAVCHKHSPWNNVAQRILTHDTWAHSVIGTRMNISIRRWSGSFSNTLSAESISVGSSVIFFFFLQEKTVSHNKYILSIHLECQSPLSLNCINEKSIHWWSNWWCTLKKRSLPFEDLTKDAKYQSRSPTIWQTKSSSTG